MTPTATPLLAASAGLDDTRLLPAGTRLDEFEILRPLGIGGFGIVYLALDHSLLRQVALKEFIPGELAARGTDGMVRPRSDCVEPFQHALESFFNEARLLAPFDHPALVRVYRFWKANGTAYMAMQYCPGVTLKEARRAMRVPPDEAWLRAFVEPILAALERLHRAGVFHRDVSPDNILLLPSGRPILLDFGSARRVLGRGTRSLTVVLKPNFAPIEQYGNETGMSQGPWTDLYALGATVHFMLTGEAPTPAVLRVVDDLRTPLAAAGGSAFPRVGAKFLAAIDWTMAVAPKDRPQSVAALREVLGDGEPRTPRRAATTPVKLPGRRGLAALVLTAFAMLAVAAAALVSTGSLLAPASVATNAPTPAPLTSVQPAPIAEPAPTPAPLQAAPTPTSDPAEPLRAQASAAAPRPDSPASATHRLASAKRPPAAAKSLPPPPVTSPGADTSAATSRRPAEACAGRNFITRAICVSRQCQAAGTGAYPECVEARRIEERRQRRIDP